MSLSLLPKKLNWDIAQDRWASIINPVLKNPATNPLLLQNVILNSGNNVVNHMLGQKLQGWYVVRMKNNFAQIYDTQDTNQTPALTLNLNSSTGVTVDLLVF
jgi:hypothetical protein